MRAALNENTAVPIARLRWGCWYGDQSLDLEFPPGFEAGVFGMKDAPPLSRSQILAALRQPIGTPPLAELAAGASTCAVAVDDISRPTPVSDLLPPLLEELASSDLTRVRIIVALGAHRPMIRSELEAKLGAWVLEHCDIEQHHPYENLVEIGRSTRGTPVTINRTFLESDLKIAVGGVMPHPYAGFSAGGKLVLPGLSGISTLRANHEAAVRGISGGLNDPEVESRLDIEEIAGQTGLRFTCNAVINSDRRIAALTCGHPVQAHRAAVEQARRIFSTPVGDQVFDVAVLNAYPKDTELLQAGNVFNCYRSRRLPLVREGGSLVIVSACSTGRGYHSLHGKDMPLYRTPVRKSWLGDRQVFFFSPNINRNDFQVSFFREYPFFQRWKDLVRALDIQHPEGARVGVFPCAPLQILI